MKKIGLVGGISWVSTIEYYRYINEGINEKVGGLNFAECIVYSLNFGDIQAKGWSNSFELLYKACLSLKKGGAEVIVLCANTAHMMASKLEEETGLPIIDVITATSDAAHKQDIKKVGLLGTKFTMEMDFYRLSLRQVGIEAIIPEKQETRDFIQQTLVEELGKGICKESTKKKYIEIIDELVDNGAEGIVLGCTEIPLIIHQNDVSVPVLNTTKIHAEAAVTFSLSL